MLNLPPSEAKKPLSLHGLHSYVTTNLTCDTLNDFLCLTTQERLDQTQK